MKHFILSTLLSFGIVFIIPIVTQAEALPQPTYPCHVESVNVAQTAPTKSPQEVNFRITYATTEQIDLTFYLKNSTTREPIDMETLSVNGEGEQTIALQFITSTTSGTEQLIYAVNYYSVTQQQEISCENGADFITVDVTESATPKTILTPSQTPSDKATEKSNWSLIGLVIVGGLFVGVGYWWIRHRTKPVVPVQPKQPGVPKKKDVCACTLSIDAPSELSLCICWHSPMTFDFSNAKAVLDIHDLQKKQTYMFSASCAPHCDGTPRDISYTWNLNNIPKVNKPIPEYLELECNAAFDATLPNEEDIHVTCSAVKKIKLIQQRCEVYIIYVAGEGGDVGYGHVAMQIKCGPNNVIYGFYSANNSLSGPGQVLNNDDPGEKYENFYPEYEKIVYNITTINKGKQLDCHQCERLVHFWKFLAEDPGMYGGDNTCTTRLADALESVGLIDMKNFKKSFWGPVVGTNAMATSYPSQFISVLFEGIAPKEVVPAIKQKG